MESNNYSILFFLKKSRAKASGEIPVCMRISYDGRRVENFIHQSIAPEAWDAVRGYPKSPRRFAAIATYIDRAKTELNEHYQRMRLNSAEITAEKLRDKLFGKEVADERTILSVFREHNEKCRKLVGIDMTATTLCCYENCLRYLELVIAGLYKAKDLPLSKVDGELIRNYEFYLKTERRCAQNTVVRYIKALKKIVNLALANGWMTRDPFFGIKFRQAETTKEFLSMAEIEMLQKREFETERLNMVKDVFLFCCYTGLAFVDVSQLAVGHLTTDAEGNRWIRKPRQKTKTLCEIPLLPPAEALLKKYMRHPQALAKGTLLPVYCNQKMNSYLQEIATRCGIKKHLTTHCARHINLSYAV